MNGAEMFVIHIFRWEAFWRLWTSSASGLFNRSVLVCEPIYV
jgi:hypothetical protein